MNYDWQVDGDRSSNSPIYPNPSKVFGGVTHGDPTSISLISSEDVPHADTVVFGLNQYRMDAETYVVCLTGIEGVRYGTGYLALSWSKWLESITVYGAVKWYNDFKFEGGKWKRDRKIVSKKATPTDIFGTAVESFLSSSFFADD